MSVRLITIASFVFVSTLSASLAGCGEPELESPEVPAKQRVVFELKNVGSATAMVATEGKGCGAWTVERLDGESWSTVRLPTGSTATECCAPGTKCLTTKRAELPSVRATRIAEGKAVWIEWDAREQLAPEGECFMRGRRLDAIEPVKAGRYRVTFGVQEASACEGDAEGCTLVTQPTRGDRCEAARVVTTEFDLPETGDVVVAVPVR